MSKLIALSQYDRTYLAATEVVMTIERRTEAGLEVPITDDCVLDVIANWTTSDLVAFNAVNDDTIVDLSDYDWMIETIFNWLTSQMA